MMYVTGFCVVGLILIAALWIRLEFILSYQTKLLLLVSSAARDDILRGRYDGWEWRFDALDEHDIGEMMLHFWKPLHWFFKDLSFTQKGVTKL